jgi:RyR domain
VTRRPVSPMSSLIADRSLRRAIFVYEAARLQAIAVDAPVVPELWPDREEPFREQFIRYVDDLCNADEFPTPEAAHDSWWAAYAEMGWVYGPVRDVISKTHPDMVPFSELEQREQDKDAVFVALVAIARDWIRA